jgi:hypothetical protein
MRFSRIGASFFLILHRLPEWREGRCGFSLTSHAGHVGHVESGVNHPEVAENATWSHGDAHTHGMDNPVHSHRPENSIFALFYGFLLYDMHSYGLLQPPHFSDFSPQNR